MQKIILVLMMLLYTGTWLFPMHNHNKETLCFELFPHDIQRLIIDECVLSGTLAEAVTTIKIIASLNKALQKKMKDYTPHLIQILAQKFMENDTISIAQTINTNNAQEWLTINAKGLNALESVILGILFHIPAPNAYDAAQAWMDVRPEEYDIPQGYKKRLRIILYNEHMTIWFLKKITTLSGATLEKIVEKIGDIAPLQQQSVATFITHRQSRAIAEKTLFTAIENNDVQIVQKLLRAGTNVNLQTAFGTALACAIQKENLKMVQILLEAGADCNRNAPGLFIPLNQIIFMREEISLPLAKLLLNAGANPFKKEGNKQCQFPPKSPYQIAQEAKRYDLIEIFNTFTEKKY